MKPEDLLHWYEMHSDEGKKGISTQVYAWIAEEKYNDGAFSPEVVRIILQRLIDYKNGRIKPTDPSVL